jgi:hypothetical protein
VKYTPSGEIAIAIRPKANCCEIAIRDQGPVLPSIMSTRSLSVTGAAQSAPRRPPAPVLGCMSPGKSYKLTAVSFGWQ